MDKEIENNIFILYSLFYLIFILIKLISILVYWFFGWKNINNFQKKNQS